MWGGAPPPVWGLESANKDSVVIIFDNKFRLIHTVNTKNGQLAPTINNSLDIFKISETKKLSKERDCTYYYTLTDEDLSRAEVIK